jgi:N-methylhydantoinase B
MATRSVDPFTSEIIKDALLAIGDEMFVTTQRTSMSTIIYEVLDFAVGLTDRQGQLITQGNGVTLFLGTLSEAVKYTVAKFGLDGLAEGDIIITNDPYTGGGTHLSDVSLIMPIFDDGEIIAFAGNKAHWTEVGGKDPGSWTTDATEVFQEGLQFPCVKLYVRGEPIQSLIDLIGANVRLPEMSLGDMYSQVASLRLAERRFRELCRKYGTDVVQATIEHFLDYGEQMARLELARLPHGEFVAEDFIDDDGIGNGPFRVCVRITIDSERVVCDFTGTAGQAPGPVNCSWTSVVSAGNSMLKALLGPDVPTNGGAFRPLTLICPPGTIFTANRPAPVSTYWETMLYIADLIWKALAPHMPDRLTAGHFLSVCGTVVAGLHPDTGEFTILVEPQAGGWGAGADNDGEDGLVCLGDGETYVIPVEVCEQRYGILVDRFGFHVTEGGEGEHRGGRGLIREYRILAESGAFVTATFGRHIYHPWGIAGGRDGSPNYIEILHADGRPPYRAGKVARYPLRQGDVIRLVTATGGGWGDPARRPREAIAADLRAGMLAPHIAREVYGYVEGS